MIVLKIFFYKFAIHLIKLLFNILNLQVMKCNEFTEKVAGCFKIYGYKFTKILPIECSLIDKSFGYEIILDEHERSLPLFFLNDLSDVLGTVYLSVFVWEGIVSINVYYK